MTNTDINKTSLIYLTGIKHSGKSNVGLYCAEHLNLDYMVSFFDLDTLILNRIPYESLRDLYVREGKGAFMRAEYEAHEEFLAARDSSHLTIMATGGGICDNHPLIDRMSENGVIIYLYLKEHTLLERIKLKGLPPFIDREEPEESFHALYLQRDSLYRKLSDHVVPLADFESIEFNGVNLAAFIKEHF